MTPPGGGDPWLVDVVIDEERRVRALARARPARREVASLAQVVDRAIVMPRVGAPHLPAVIRVANRLLARELAEMPLGLEVVVGPTPGIGEAVVSVAADYVPPDGSWRWFRSGVGPASVKAMFDQLLLFTTTFAWFVLSGQEAIRAFFPSRAETLYLRLETRRRVDGEMTLALHIAPDEETLAAWREGLTGERQVTVSAIEQGELSREAFIEVPRVCHRRRELYPRVTVGLTRREPDLSEWSLALRALEAFCLLYDPREGSTHGVQRRELASGDRVELEVLAPDLEAFPENESGIEIVEDSPASRAERLFLDSYLNGVFDRAAAPRAGY